MSQDSGSRRDDVRDTIRSVTATGSSGFVGGGAGGFIGMMGRYLDILSDLSPSPPLGGVVHPMVNMVGALLIMYPIALFVAAGGLFLFVPTWLFILAMATVITAPQRDYRRYVEFSGRLYLAVSAALGALHVVSIQSRLGLPGVAVVIAGVGLMNLYWLWYARRYLG
jgi:hypothetical protein